MMAFILVVVVGIALVIAIVLCSNSFDFTYESAKSRAGKRGEKIAEDIIRRILRDDDYLLTNVEIEYDGRPTELDNVVVNNFGVFIFEVKNYSGILSGNEDDYEWEKNKITEAGNIYSKMVKNPIKQVKRQVYILAKYLDYYGKKVWINGYAILIQNNSPVQSDLVISSEKELDKAIHTRGRNRLSKKDVEQIVNLLKED